MDIKVDVSGALHALDQLLDTEEHLTRAIQHDLLFIPRTLDQVLDLVFVGQNGCECKPSCICCQDVPRESFGNMHEGCEDGCECGERFYVGPPVPVEDDAVVEYDAFTTWWPGKEAQRFFQTIAQGVTPEGLGFLDFEDAVETMAARAVDGTWMAEEDRPLVAKYIKDNGARVQNGGDHMTWAAWLFLHENPDFQGE